MSKINRPKNNFQNTCLLVLVYMVIQTQQQLM